jgi:hypothetical protein
MPAVTENFNLVYSLQGEVLFSEVEYNRYNIIDRQLFGVFKILGNGIIKGWEVSASADLTIDISTGSGVIDYKYHETTTTAKVLNIPPNSLGYIYAEQATGVPTNIVPGFFYSKTEDVGEGEVGSKYILLSTIVTGANNISSVDNSVANNIDFVEAALDLVRDHKHTGGSNPSQIDLARHVRGQLPNENIGDLDADKITSGRLLSSVMPQLDHHQLDNIGTLTHPQLDSYIKMLTFDNTHLFGEVAGTNMLQLYMAQKHVWTDVDRYTANFLSISPGLSPDSFTDFDASNAEIDDINHVIKGVVATGGSIINKTYNITDDFKGYDNIVDIIVDSNTLYLDKASDSEIILMDFEDGILSGDSIPGFVKTISAITDNTTFTFDDNDVQSGVYAGKLDVADVVQLAYTNTYSNSIDLTDYDELLISVKTTSFTHGQIFVDIYNNGSVVLELSVLADSEVTDGFKTISTDITTIDRDAINQIVIRTDTSMGWDISDTFAVSFDDIKAVGEGVYFEKGTIRYIAELPVSAQWEAISWDADLNGGNFKVRGRSATTVGELLNVPFSPYVVNSGDSPEVDKNPVFEFEVTLESDGLGANTPIVNSLRLTYIVPSSDNGFVVDDLEDWDNGTYTDKVDLLTTPGVVRIKEPISVNNIFYGNSFIIQELDPSDIPLVGFRGQNILLSPNKVVINDLEAGFDMVNSMDRSIEAVYRFCDTGNDRILEVDFNGEFVYGMGSFNESSEFLGVMSVVYNPRLETIQIVFSREVLLAGLDLSELELRYDGQVSLLDNNSSVIEDNSISSDGAVKILKIQLSPQINSKLFEADDIAIILRSGFFIIEELSDFFVSTNLVKFSGFPVFSGDFLYVEGIFQPVSVEKSDSGSYLIGNAKRWGRANEGISTIAEYTNEGFVTFAYDRNDYKFTLETLGNAKYFSEDYIISAGISGTASRSLTSDSNIESTTIIAGEGRSEFIIQNDKTFKLKVETLDKEMNIVYGDRYLWSSDNNVVASVNVNGVVTAHAVGFANITATAVPKGNQTVADAETSETDTEETVQISDTFTGLPRTATARIQVDIDETINYSVSTVEFTNTELDMAGIVETEGEDQPDERNAIGYVYLIGVGSQNVVFSYVSPEGSYPSKVDFDEDKNLYISEKSFTARNQGRVIKVDLNGNILFEYGFGEFDSPNDVKSLLRNEIIVSS